MAEPTTRRSFPIVRRATYVLTTLVPLAGSSHDVGLPDLGPLRRRGRARPRSDLGSTGVAPLVVLLGETAPLAVANGTP